MLKNQVVESFQVNSFVTFQNNEMYCVNFSNHNNLCMIWKFHLNSVDFVFEKAFKVISYNFPSQIFTQF